MKRKKVCHFSSVHTTTDTRVFHRECVSLAKHYDVTLIAIGNNTGIHKGVNVIGLPKPKNRISRLLTVTRKVFSEAWKVNADLYHIHDAEMIPFAFVFSLLGKKVIYDIHENTYADITHKPWIPDWLRSISGAGYRLLEWITAQSMYTILVIAKPEFARRFITGKYSIVQNFADVPDFSSFRVTGRSTNPEHHLFYIGTIFDYYYDFIPVIRALNLLRSRGITVHLHAVGYTGHYVDQHIKTLDCYPDIAPQLHFHGLRKTADGYEFSKQCKIGLCLKNQPADILVSHERKFFEYMAIGMPVLCCDSHIYREVIDEWQMGRYTNLQDPEAIAATLAAMLNDPEGCKRMEQQAVKAAEMHFNWASQEKILFEVYEDLLK